MRFATAVAVLLGILLLGCGGKSTPVALDPNVPPPKQGQYEPDTARPALPKPDTVTYRGRQTMDVYRPPSRFAGRRPVILWMHPGGWTTADYEPGVRIYYPLIERQVGRGYALAAVSYPLVNGRQPWNRQPNRFPVPLEYVKAAIRWIKANSARYGIDPGRVILAGATSGGQLALLVPLTPGRYEPAGLPPALRAQNEKVLGIIGIAAATNLWILRKMPDFYGFNADLAAARHLGCDYPKGCTNAQVARASPLAYLRDGRLRRSLPPIFLAYGLQDPFPNQPIVALGHGRPLRDAWRRAKGTASGAFYDEVEQAGHFLGRAENGDRGHINRAVFERWLDAVSSGRLR